MKFHLAIYRRLKRWNNNIALIQCFCDVFATMLQRTIQQNIDPKTSRSSNSGRKGSWFRIFSSFCRFNRFGGDDCLRGEKKGNISMLLFVRILNSVEFVVDVGRRNSCLSVNSLAIKRKKLISRWIFNFHREADNGGGREKVNWPRD